MLAAGWAAASLGTSAFRALFSGRIQPISRAPIPKDAARGVVYAGGQVAMMMFFSPFESRVATAAEVQGTMLARLEATPELLMSPLSSRNREPRMSLMPATGAQQGTRVMVKSGIWIQMI